MWKTSFHQSKDLCVVEWSNRQSTLQVPVTETRIFTRSDIWKFCFLPLSYLMYFVLQHFQESDHHCLQKKNKTKQNKSIINSIIVTILKIHPFLLLVHLTYSRTLKSLQRRKNICDNLTVSIWQCSFSDLY